MLTLARRSALAGLPFVVAEYDLITVHARGTEMLAGTSRNALQRTLTGPRPFSPAVLHIDYRDTHRPASIQTTDQHL